MAAPSFDRRMIPIDARITRWRAPDGWQMRRFDWSPQGAPKGRILFQGGRGDVFEKYLESLHHWRAQGWAVTSFDWRGQGGSGRYPAPRACGHVPDFDLFVDDLEHFYRDWWAEGSGPHVVMGHSMGGHLVLRALAERRIAPDAAVLIAPMLGLRTPFGAKLGERLAGLLARLGDPARPAWKGNERPYTTETRANLLTHDAARYADELWWQAAQPDLMTGPPSWRWVIEAFRSTRELRDNPALGGMAVPLLCLIADRDGLVDARAAIATMARIPGAQVERFGAEAAHELLREADPVRNRALDAIDTFLAEKVGAA